MKTNRSIFSGILLTGITALCFSLNVNANSASRPAANSLIAVSDTGKMKADKMGKDKMKTEKSKMKTEKKKMDKMESDKMKMEKGKMEKGNK